MSARCDAREVSREDHSSTAVVAFTCHRHTSESELRLLGIRVGPHVTCVQRAAACRECSPGGAAAFSEKWPTSGRNARFVTRVLKLRRWRWAPCPLTRSRQIDWRGVSKLKPILKMRNSHPMGPTRRSGNPTKTYTRRVGGATRPLDIPPGR